MAIPVDLTQEERDQVEAWVRKQRKKRKLAHLRGTDLDDHIEACLDWHRALPERDRRKQRSDWAAAVRNWIRMADERKGQGTGYATSAAQEYGQRQHESKREVAALPDNVVSLADRVGKRV